MTQDTKDRFQYASALAMIAVSLALAVASFVMLHLVHSTVLTFVGEAVGFAGGVYGLSAYAHSKSAEIEQRFEQLQQTLLNHAKHQ